MSTFCYDQYDHPLLWCDEKKRLAERKNAEESIRQWRRKKAEEMVRKDREKQEYHELFVKHCPWGRPGGGAPNADIRRRDITASGLHSIPSLNVSYHNKNLSLPPCRYMDLCPLPKPRKHCLAVTSAEMSSGGAGHNISLSSSQPKGTTASDSDQLCITLKEHPAMTFRNKGHVDIELRYKSQPKGKPTLDKIVVKEKEQSPCVELKKVTAHVKNDPKDPWGKPGPGGKPWRSPKAIGSSFMKSMGWTNKEMLKELDQDNPITPAEKMQKSPKKSKQPKKLEKCCALCTCTCPFTKASAPKQCAKKPSFREPKTDPRKPKICPRFARQCAANDEGVELVPLLAKRRANNRPISLSSTDVTKRTADSSWARNADLHYLRDLNKQMSQKRRGVTLNKQEDRNLCKTHFETFETFWGRPGHGAPTDTKNKLKLDDLLYGSHSCSE